MNIKEIIKEATGKNVVDCEYYKDVWLSWYEGNVKDFHTYKTFNGIQDVTCYRKTLNMAKKVCEDWANLLLNEKTDYTIEGDDNQETLNRLMNDIGFWAKGNDGVEKTFALGNGAFVESFTDDRKPKIQFINATKIYPITIEDGVVTESAFASVNTNNINIQIHLKDADGNYIIRTLIGDVNGKDYIMHFNDIDRDYIFETKTKIPFFQFYKPAIANNIDIDNPLGISVFANAKDELKGVDLAYDGYCNEMEVGKLRAFIDKRLTKFVNGQKQPIFNNRDTFFYCLGNGEDESKKPMEFYAPTLRVTDYFNGINNSLNLLSAKVGFGANHYRFDQGGISTATQVISENSEMFRTLKKHEIVLNEVLIGVIKALIYICNNFCDETYRFTDVEKINIEIKFDDSIIEDKESQKQSDRQDVAMGVMSKAEFRSKWYNEDEETAKKIIDEIKASEPNISNFFSGE